MQTRARANIWQHRVSCDPCAATSSTWGTRVMCLRGHKLKVSCLNSNSPNQPAAFPEGVRRRPMLTVLSYFRPLLTIGGV